VVAAAVWCAQVCALDLCPVDPSVYRSDFLELQVCHLMRQRTELLSLIDWGDTA
jgi:hypothetical protein